MLKASLTPKPSYSTLQRRFENGNSGNSGKVSRQRGGMRRRTSFTSTEDMSGLLLVKSSEKSTSDNDNKEENHLPIRNSEAKETDDNSCRSVDVSAGDEGSNEGNQISGCRRRIQNNRPSAKKNSKSGDATRRFRSHSPLPCLQPKEVIDVPKTKVVLS